MATNALKKRPWYAHWWGVLIVVFAALLAIALGYFAQQFSRYYALAKQGRLSDADLVFGDRFTSSVNLRARLEAIPATEVELSSSDDPAFGNPGASFVIVEFADFGCPWSREESFIIRELTSRYADKIYYIYRDFPLDDLHPAARAAAEAGECAQELGNFWAYHDKLYQNQLRLGRDDLVRYAREIGLAEAEFIECLDSGRYAAEVQEDLETGLRAGVRGTPTFFMNGRRIEGAIPREILEEILKAVTS